MRKIFISLIILITVLIYPAIIYGQMASLSIDPPQIESIIRPGKSVTVTYTVQNLGDPVVVSVSVSPFSSRDDGGIVIQDELKGPIDFSLDNKDIKLNDPFLLNSKQSRQIILRMSLPKDTPEGDYYYSLLVSSEPPPPQETKGATARIQAKVGANILISVTNSGILELSGKVAIFQALSPINLGKLPIFDSSDKIPIVLLVRNEGKNFIQSTGDITLRGNFGESANYTLLPRNILSKAARLMMATPSATVNCEKNSVLYCQRPVSLILSGLFIGKYDLSTNISFGEGTPIVSSSTSFIALPYKLVLGVLGALLISYLLIKGFNRRK